MCREWKRSFVSVSEVFLADVAATVYSTHRDPRGSNADGRDAPEHAVERQAEEDRAMAIKFAPSKAEADEPALTPRGASTYLAQVPPDKNDGSAVSLQTIDIQMQVDTKQPGSRSVLAVAVFLHGTFPWNDFLGAASPCTWSCDFDTNLSCKQMQKPLLQAIVLPSLRQYYRSPHYLQRKSASPKNAEALIPVDAITVTVNGQQLDKGKPPNIAR